MELKGVGPEAICLNRPPDTVAAVSTFTDRRAVRPGIQGKFIFLARQKLYLRGVTYGTFRPDPNGDEFPSVATVRRAFPPIGGAHIHPVGGFTPASPPRLA